MNCVVDKFRETASVMGAEKWINYELEKSKEFLAVLQPFGKICVAKVPDVVFPPLQQFGKRCVAKLDEVFPLLQRFGNLCIAKARDEVFPPLQQFGKLCIAQLDEVFPLLQRFGKLCTTKVLDYVFPALWLFGKICIIGMVVILVVILMNLILRCFFSGGRGGSTAKMMIAPGTGRAIKIPRSSFEASPKSYFRGLRGK